MYLPRHRQGSVMQRHTSVQLPHTGDALLALKENKLAMTDIPHNL